MRARSYLLPGIIAFAIGSPVALADVKVGDKAPKFTATNWFNLPKEMKKLTRKELNGQIVLLEFWATW